MLTKTKIFKTQDYNCELIHLFLSVSYKSSVAYIASVLLFLWVFSPYLPFNLFLLILGAHIFYQFMRIYYVKKYKRAVFSINLKKKFLRQHTALLTFGSVIWGLSAYAVILFTPEHFEFVMLFLIIAMAAGSIATLSVIYRAYVAFNLPMILLLASSFIYKGEDMHMYALYSLPVFTYVVFSASWEMHKSLKASIELKDLYVQSQEALKDINASLEQRIDQAVKENHQKDKQMLEQSRLAQMGEMLSMIAHQWRQPLASITATTGSMTLHMQLEEKYDEKYMEEALQRVNTYTQYLSTTITDFRNFFKPDKEKTITSLNDIVLGSLKIIGPALEAQSITIETLLESNEEFLSFPNELKQVVLNIMKNAQDAFIEKNIAKPQLLLKTLNFEDKVQLIISDNAGGISEDQKACIFDPYFTTKEKRDGTGLGLYMSKMIVEDHCNGRIVAENEGAGASFILTLPLK